MRRLKGVLFESILMGSLFILMIISRVRGEITSVDFIQINLMIYVAFMLLHDRVDRER